MITWDDIRHFKPREFACKCGNCDSDGLEMDLDFVFALDELRDETAVPFVVTSGYRCPDHNEAISTTGRDGPHTTGRAVDVHLVGPSVHRLLLNIRVGSIITGIGMNQKGAHTGRFVHLDSLPGTNTRRRPWVWTY